MTVYKKLQDYFDKKVTFGIRTVNDSAKENSEFEPLHEILEFEEGEVNKNVEVTLIFDNEWPAEED